MARNQYYHILFFILQVIVLSRNAIICKVIAENECEANGTNNELFDNEEDEDMFQHDIENEDTVPNEGVDKDEEIEDIFQRELEYEDEEVK